jgi:HAMP domain-containing protein
MRRPSLRWLLSPRQPDDDTETGARTSIAGRLRWTLLLSSVVPLLIVGALLIALSSGVQQRSVYNDQIDLATRVERDISRYVDELHKQLEGFALKVRPTTGHDQLISLAKDLVDRNYPNIIQFSVLDDAGRERLRMIKLLTVADSELINRGGESGVLLALREGRTSYTPIRRNADGVRSFIVTLPLRNDGNTVVGVLRAEMNAEPIAQELLIAIANSKSYPYLIEATSGVVLVDDGKPGFTPPRQLNRLLIAPNGAEQYVGARDQDVIGAMMPVVLNNGQDVTGWAVVVEQPSAEAFTSVRNSALLLGMLVILVGALALLIAFRQAQQFLRPLKALRTGALALGTGQLSYRIEPLGDDEMGDLAQTFNGMAEHLQESLDEIEKRNERLRRAMALARDIQIGLLPDRPPWNGDEIAVYARSIPAYEVGGDFYSYLAMSEGRAAIAMLFVVIDPRARTLRVANAGMISPMLVTPRGSHIIEVGGLPIGSFVGAQYREEVVSYEPGDSLLLVSDGVVEAHDSHNELFGFERLDVTIAQAQPGDIRGLVELVLERVQEHMGDMEQHDDITIVAVRPAVITEIALLDEEQTITYATL